MRAHHEPHWASRIANCAAWIEQSDYYGIERYFGLFGGMGSLNDLVLHRNGHWLTTENDELQALLARASKMANALRDEQRGIR